MLPFPPDTEIGRQSVAHAPGVLCVCCVYVCPVRRFERQIVNHNLRGLARVKYQLIVALRGSGSTEAVALPINRVAEFQLVMPAEKAVMEKIEVAVDLILPFGRVLRIPVGAGGEACRQISPAWVSFDGVRIRRARRRVVREQPSITCHHIQKHPTRETALKLALIDPARVLIVDGRLEWTETAGTLLGLKLCASLVHTDQFVCVVKLVRELRRVLRQAVYVVCQWLVAGQVLPVRPRTSHKSQKPRRALLATRSDVEPQFVFGDPATQIAACFPVIPQRRRIRHFLRAQPVVEVGALQLRPLSGGCVGTV